MAAQYPAYRASEHNGYSYPYPPSNHDLNDRSSRPKEQQQLERETRTPSPTPSEERELQVGAFDWQKWRNWRFWIRREWLWYYVAIVIIVVAVGLITIFHTQIVHWLRPVADWMHDLKYGWLIPIAILFVLSFPPLFGHEIVAVLCGLVWGLWIGFAIVAAGTFVGEIGNYYAFKYCCRARGAKLEKSEISYACLAKVVRDGGFKIVFIARLSAIPGHFTTAVFSTCGVGIFTFCIAAILSLPKQFTTVYLGVILEGSQNGTTSTKTRIINYAIVAISTIITFVAMWYIYHKMGQVKPAVIYERRKARQGKITRAEMSPYSNPAFASTTNVPFNPSDVYAGGDGTSPYQQWDKEGRAVGYAGDPRLYAPQPQRMSSGFGMGQNAIGRAGSTRADGPSNDEAYAAGMVYPMSEARDGRIPVRQESEESIGWDMRNNSGQGQESYELPRIVSPPGLPNSALRDPFASTASVNQPMYASPSGPPPSSSTAPSLPPTIPPPPRSPRIFAQAAVSHPGSPMADASHTPTQSQYATYARPADGAYMSPPLPTPSYPSSYSTTPTQGTPSQASYYIHAPEASDGSFHTATGDHSRMNSEAPLEPPSTRTFSPPPPSYHTSSDHLR